MLYAQIFSCEGDWLALRLVAQLCGLRPDRDRVIKRTVSPASRKI
jgi:hypothetical protein